jgi:hypothetical protein
MFGCLAVVRDTEKGVTEVLLARTPRLGEPVHKTAHMVRNARFARHYMDKISGSREVNGRKQLAVQE